MQTTEERIRQLGLSDVRRRLEEKGLTIVDKSDLEFTLKQIASKERLESENRILRARLKKGAST